MITLLLGCASLPDWSEVRSLCQLEGGETAPLAWSRVEVTPDPDSLDVECVQALGDAFKVDWDSFGTTAAAASDPTQRESALFGGLYALVASDVGTVGDLRDLAETSELLVGDEDASTVLERLGDEAPAARFYTEYFWTVVTEVRQTTGDTCSFSTLQGGIIDVCSGWFRSDQLEYLGSSYSHTNTAVASALVHESIHQSQDDPGHIDEPCEHDASPDYAYGAGARWLASWETHAVGLVGADDLDVASATRNGACARIEDHGAWTPCDGATGELCNGDANVTPIR